jgi:hypothetical protein
VVPTLPISLLAQLEQEARTARRGLWIDPNPIPRGNGESLAEGTIGVDQGIKSLYATRA